MADRSVVTAKGQVTIPKAVRDRLGIHAADVVEFEVRQGEAILRRAQPERPMVTTLDLLASRLKVRLLRYLAAHQGMHTGRDLASAGLLVRRRAAPAYLYSLNMHHYLVSHVLLPAFQAEQGWAESLGQEVRALGGRDIASVILYGSASCKTDTPASDVDLAVIVGPGGDCALVEEVVRARHGALHERYGRAVSFLVIEEKEFRARAARRDPLVSSVLAHGRVAAGQPIAGILAGMTADG